MSVETASEPVVTAEDLRASVAPTVQSDPQTVFDAERRDLEKRLLANLRTTFPHARPNYARPLDGRVVEYRTTGPGQPARAVTDYELAGARTFGIPAGPEFVDERIAAGQRIRQVWHWECGGIAFRFNASWKACSHFGYQQLSTCATCRTNVWTTCDRPAHARCRTCRATSGTCSEIGLACSTAYKAHGCRCNDCRQWNAARMRRVRQRPELNTESRKPVLSRSTSDTGTGSTPDNREKGPSTKKRVTRRPEPETWTWLPVELRDHIARHAAIVAGHFTRKDAARRRCFCRGCKERGFLREELSAGWLCLNCDPKRRGLVSGSAEYWETTRLNIVTD